MNPSTHTPFRVLIVGGGVAGLEAALALRDLAGERVATTLLAPAAEFVYRPMRVREPFGYSEARHYPLDEISRDIGVELVQGRVQVARPRQSHGAHRGGSASSSTTRFCWRSERSCDHASGTP